MLKRSLYCKWYIYKHDTESSGGTLVFFNRYQFARIHISSLISIGKILNRSTIDKFYNGNEVNVIAAELRLTKTRPTSFYKKHIFL